MTKEGDKYVYQLQTLKKFDQAEAHFTAMCVQLCSSVTRCLKSRLEWSDLELIRDMVVFLATQGWQKILDDQDAENETDPVATEAETPIQRLGRRFKIPLEAAGVDTEKLQEEFTEVLVYATQFISLSTMGYQAVWWRLFHAPEAGSWSNILGIARLVFTLPVSNGKLERIFSTLKIIKVDRRSTLGNDSLDDLLAVNSELVPLKEFNPDHSIQLWWSAVTRRPNQRSRKAYKKRSVSSATSGTSTATASSNDADLDESSSDTDTIDTANTSESPSSGGFSLHDWDNWIEPDTDTNLIFSSASSIFCMFSSESTAAIQ